MSGFFHFYFEQGWSGRQPFGQGSSPDAGAGPCWTPPVNVYRHTGGLSVCVELAGVRTRELHLLVEPRRLVIRGHRPPPEPRTAGRPFQVLAMEIDHGRFERELWLPVEVEPNRASAERREGWLWIHLPLKGGS